MKIEHEALGVASTVVHTAAVNISGFHGYGRGAADRWLQLHDAKARPADTAVPLRVWPLFAAAPFGEAFPDEIRLVNGAVFVVSTTEATLTYDAATVVDIFVTGDSAWNNAGTSVAGDYTTADEVLQVWADASGPKRLKRIEAAYTLAGPGTFLQIHAGDTPATDKIVASFEFNAANNYTLDLFFDLVPVRIVDAVVYDGCTIAMSNDKDIYAGVGGADFTIKATYKNA
jgi:hypothetical protein